jgi:hypothetical protein
MNRPLCQFVHSETDVAATDQLMKSLNIDPTEALAKGLVNKDGVYFEKTGKEIQTAIAGKIKKLEEEINELQGVSKQAAKVQKLGDATLILPEDPANYDGPCAPTSNYDPNQWRIESKQNEIKRLSSIARNIDTKKKFSLAQWDLDQYGF